MKNDLILMKQIATIEITDKTIVVIHREMPIEKRIMIEDAIEMRTGIRPPVLPVGDAEVSAIELTDKSLLVIKGEERFLPNEFAQTLLKIREHVQIIFPALFLGKGADVSAIQDREELTRLRDTINTLLEKFEVPA